MAQRLMWVLWPGFLVAIPAVGIVFTRDENVATWKYLRRVAERIIATPEPGTLIVNQETGEDEILNPPEVLGNGCRFCIRAATCEAPMAHVDARGIVRAAVTNASFALPVRASARRGRCPYAIVR
jgi:hypothetical protein